MEPVPDPLRDRSAFARWQVTQRLALREMLGMPRGEPVALDAQPRGQLTHDGLVIEKWLFTAEPGSRVPCVLYRPAQAAEPALPAMVMTYGHGGSKSQPDYVYPAVVFAKLGFAVLAIDPIGEEERHAAGRMGTRAHDPEPVHRRSCESGRLIMGKLVWDTMRGIDFLLQRGDIDAGRIGVAGNSLGGATAGWMAATDPRLRFAVVSGWAFAPMTEQWGKFCTRVPNVRMRRILTWEQYLCLAAPHCVLRIANGDADVIIDKDGQGQAWRDMDGIVAAVAGTYAAAGRPGGITTWYEQAGGHRPYQAHKANVAWLVDQVRPAGWTSDRVHALGQINFGRWCRDHGYPLEPLYGTPLHLLGAAVVDMQVRPLRREQLAVLRPQELGLPQYTIEGWLDHVDPVGARRM